MSRTMAVVGRLPGPPEPVGAVVGDVDVEALGPQADRERVGDAASSSTTSTRIRRCCHGGPAAPCRD